MRRLSPRGGLWVIILLALLTFLRVCRLSVRPYARPAHAQPASVSAPTIPPAPPSSPAVTPVAVPTWIPLPEPAVTLGRVIYRATKAASFETLGVTVIACRHRDPGPRQFTVDFFDEHGQKVMMFGPYIAGDIPPGKKVVFVTDGMAFRNRDVVDVRLGHLTGGPARVISDAKKVTCMGKIRFNGGKRSPTKWGSIGLVRLGVGATPAPPPAGW